MQLFKIGLIRGVALFLVLQIFSVGANGLVGHWHSSLINGLILFFFGTASVIYQIKKWSFLKQVIVHYIAMLLTIFPTILLSGSYPLNSVSDYLKVYLDFNMSGVMLFFFTFVIFNLYRKLKNRKTTEV